MKQTCSGKQELVPAIKVVVDIYNVLDRNYINDSSLYDEFNTGGNCCNRHIQDYVKEKLEILGIEV